MTAAQLRQSILQAAIQGKLVPQDAHDEPASELLKRIQVEKAHLIKEGKIKKEKPLPPIAEDEMPYDLPEGWVWQRFGNLTINRDYERIPVSRAERHKRAKIYDYYGASGIIDKIDGFLFDKPLLLIGEDGANLLARSTPIAFIASGKYWVNNHAHVIDAISLDFLNYICLHINAIDLSPYVTGTAQPKMNQEKMNAIALAVPPLAEQQRIVAKVDELMALCDELEAAEKELDRLENNFAEHLPKSILQAAVQGKLVPQNMHDEPASELLKHIRAEKARLVKEGKIKKDKPLPPITEEEMPYDLPEGWVWCRLGEIVEQNIGGGTPSKSVSEYWDGNIPWASVKDLSGKYLRTTQDSITEAGLNNSASNLIPEGNVIVCTRMGLGKISINTVPIAINQDLRALLISSNVDIDYFIYYYQGLSIAGSGMTVKGITIEELHSLNFPLPPLAEQQRIVAKVDELMALSNELKTAGALPIAPAQSATVIPFPARVTAPEEPAVEEEYLIAARGDMQNLSAEAATDIDELLNSNADS